MCSTHTLHLGIQDTQSKWGKEVRGSRVKKRCPYYIYSRKLSIRGVLREGQGSTVFLSLSSLAAKRLSVVSGGGVAELAEEDQDEDETTLILPPDKDPATQHRTNSLIGKNSPNKQLVYISL